MPVVPDLVLLLCDTARADAFRPWGGRVETPHIQRICGEGIAYSRATAPAPWTVPSIASIFSGRLPTQHGVSGESFQWIDGRPTSQAPVIRSYAGSWLPEALRVRGYRTYAASCNAWVSRWGGFDRGFDEFVQLSDQDGFPRGELGSLARRAMRLYGKVDKGGRRALHQFQRWIGEPVAAPLFTFVNLMELHDPYDPPRPHYPYAFWKRPRTRILSGGSKASRQIRAAFEFGQPPAEYVSVVRNLYLAAARYEDWLLGRFVEAVEDRGRPCVVVVVSDHGENLGEHGQFKHNSSLAQTLLHVPLVVWGHKVDVGQGLIDEPVSLLGLAEWLMALVDGDGGPMTGDGPVISEYESAIRHPDIGSWIVEVLEERGLPMPALVQFPGVAIRQGKTKYVAVENGEEALYDLEADPGEDHNILAWEAGAAAEFRPLRDTWRERLSSLQAPDGEGELADAEIAEHLRSLGYID